MAVKQLEVFEAARIFAKTEGFVPASESAHAVKAAINEALKIKKEGKSKTILFNLSRHGLLDLSAYNQYLSGEMEDYDYPEEKVLESFKAFALGKYE
jgi:tryptophan synthase beta chain